LFVYFSTRFEQPTVDHGILPKLCRSGGCRHAEMYHIKQKKDKKTRVKSSKLVKGIKSKSLKGKEKPKSKKKSKKK
jgi:hypothetical protein